MTVYYTILFVLISMRAAGVKGGVYYYAALTALFVFSGFRFEVGCDWAGYLYHWVLSYGKGASESVTQHEPAHWLMIELLQDAGFSFTALMVTSSAIFFIGLHVLARVQPNPFSIIVLAYPVLIINLPMSGIRQAEAVGIMCLAYNAFVKRNVVLFVVFVVVASLFHQSALIFLLLSPLIIGKPSVKTVLMAIIVALPGVYVLAGSSGAELATSRYINTGVDAAGAIFRLGTLVLTGVAFFTVLSERWRVRYPGDYNLAFYSSMLMIGIIALLPVSTVIADRLGYYLMPLQAVILARIAEFRDIELHRILTVLPYFGYSLLFVVWTQASNEFNQCYVPYKFNAF